MASKAKRIKPDDGQRVYRPVFSVEEATDIMREGRGSHFDPEPLDALLSDADTLLEVRRATRRGLTEDPDYAICGATLSVAPGRLAD